MAKGSSKKKRSMAYRLVHEETGHHYVLRLGREGYDKMREKKVKKFNPVLRTHALYIVKKTSK